MIYLEDIKEAITETKEPYCKWKDWYKNKYAMLERVFCYEFYHQFREIMDKSKNKQKYKDLYFHGEMTKYGKVPDFVLHKGEDNNDFQAVVMEVKTKERIRQNAEGCNMKEDLERLLSLMKNRDLKYRYGGFIGINCNSSFLKEEIQKMPVETFENYRDLLDKLYIIGTEDNSPFTLSSVIS